MSGARLYLVSLFVSIALLICPARALADDVTITGVVNSQGNPLAGATVVAWTAAPRTGPAYYCPSCYQDCGTSTVSGEDGTFRLKLVDPKLVWRLLVVREGHVPQFVRNIDPDVTTPTVELVPRDWAKIPAGRIVHGVVKDSRGEPIAGATVEPDTVMFVVGGGRGGAVDGLDPLAVTNEKGEFRLAYQGDGGMVDTMDLTARAKAYARTCVFGLKPSPESNVIVLSRGVTVTGHLVKGGEPVGGFEMGLCPSNRSSGNCFGHDEIATFEDGRFLFSNVPPIGEHVVYGIHDSIWKLGATEPKRFMAEKEGAIIDVGNVEIVPGRRVQGRVVLSDGAAVPKEAKIFIAQELAWDSITQDLSPSGAFDLRSVPDGDCMLTVAAVPGYEMSPTNRSFADIDVHRLDGRIDGDIKDLTVLMIPQRAGPKAPREIVQPIEVPLVGTRGFEGTMEPTPAAKPSGTKRLRVVCEGADGTFKPLAGASVRIKKRTWMGMTVVNGESETAAPAEVVSDERGECELSGLERDLYVYPVCSKSGYEQLGVYGIAPGGDGVAYEVKMVERSPEPMGECVVLRIVDAKGQPLENAKVTIVSNQMSRRRSASPPKADFARRPETLRSQPVTDKDGRAAFSISEEFDGIKFQINAPGYAMVVTDPIARGETTLTMSRGGTLAGLAIGPGGEPLAGAIVRLAVDMTIKEPVQRLQLTPTLGWTKADAKGRYEFTHVMPRVAAIVHIARESIPGGFVSGRVRIITPTDGESAQAGQLSTERGVRLAGRVTLEADLKWTGEPSVSVMDEDTREVVRASVLEDGRFAFPAFTRGARIRVRPGVDSSMSIDKDTPGMVSWSRCIMGTLNEDLGSLAIPLVKWRPEDNSAGPPRRKPLRGVEK
ncbi:MAG: carboxypeptidase-like regulatory domain-containing protein [Planctomycetota bacterium]